MLFILFSFSQALASEPKVIFSPKEPVLLTHNQMSRIAHERGATNESQVLVTIKNDDNSLIKVLTKLNQQLYGHPFTPLGNHKVMAIAEIAIVDAQTLVGETYIDDIDMSKLEGNLNIFWYGGGAALIASAIYACSHLLVGG